MVGFLCCAGQETGNQENQTNRLPWHGIGFTYQDSLISPFNIHSMDHPSVKLPLYLKIAQII